MMSLISARLGALILLSAALFGYIQTLKIATLRVERESAQQGNAERDALIQTLHQQASEHEAAQLALQQQLAHLHQVHTQRKTTIQKNYETKTVRTWANARLPESIIGLRQHVDFIGTASYAQRLPQGNSLPTPRQCAKDKR